MPTLDTPPNENVGRFKNADFYTEVANTAKESKTGLVIGAGVGLVYALITHKSKLLSTAIGAVLFGLIGYAIQQIKK